MLCHSDLAVRMTSLANPVNPENQNFPQSWFQFLWAPLWALTINFFEEIHFIEMFFIKLHNAYAFTSQMLFFILCALAFDDTDFLSDIKKDRYVLLALKTLLFFSVFTYFVSKTRDIWIHHQGRLLHSNWNFMESICKIALEWAKAIVVVFCLREKGINFQPNLFYIATTLPFYICTEKVFLEIIELLIRLINFEVLENLEHLYVPLVLNTYTLLTSFLIEIYLLISKYYLIAILCSYILIYLKVKDTYYNYWTLIRLEKQMYESFRSAEEWELHQHDDVCAICLNKMSRAKITPCKHFFHPLCLKECLKNSFLCPICKLELATTNF